jgi:hypothetical protein
MIVLDRELGKKVTVVLSAGDVLVFDKKLGLAICQGREAPGTARVIQRSLEGSSARRPTQSILPLNMFLVLLACASVEAAALRRLSEVGQGSDGNPHGWDRRRRCDAIQYDPPCGVRQQGSKPEHNTFCR